MIHLNKVHHIAIICTDYERSLKFYTDVLGLRIVAEHYRADRQSYKTDLAIGNSYVVELFSFPSPPKRQSHPEQTGLRHIAFEVDDIEETARLLAEKNVLTESIRTDEYTGKRFFFIQDPDNQPIELYEK